MRDAIPKVRELAAAEFATNFDPYRRPTMTPGRGRFSLQQQELQTPWMGSMLEAAWGSNGTPMNYHRYREDIATMRDIGVGAYRFSRNKDFSSVLKSIQETTDAPRWHADPRRNNTRRKYLWLRCKPCLGCCSNIVPLRQPDEIDDPLTNILRGRTADALEDAFLQVVEHDIAGDPAKIPEQDRPKRAQRPCTDADSATLQSLDQRAKIAVARKQHHLVDPSGKLHGIDREFDVHLAPEPATAGHVDDQLGAFRIERALELLHDLGAFVGNAVDRPPMTSSSTIPICRSNGTSRTPAEMMAHNADPAVRAAWLDDMFLPPDAFDWALNVVVVRSGEQTILIDAGLGLVQGPTIGVIWWMLQKRGPAAATARNTPSRPGGCICAARPSEALLPLPG